MIFIVILIATFGFLGYKWYKGNQMVSTDKLFQQRDVTIDYTAGTITIRKFTYPVSMVNTVTKITEYNGRRTDHFIKIDVDDMNKPVHKIAVIGTEHNADEFHQRICVALRKAGAQGFI